VEQRKQGRGWRQRFLGFRARLNCEEIPVIPAWLVRNNLNDPRRIPYLLVWKNKRDGEIQEIVRLACCIGPHDSYDSVELKRADGSLTGLRFAWRKLPRNGGRSLFLVCSVCDTPRRFVYGWEWDSFSGRSNRVWRIGWRCRSCARLRYSSEGGYLRVPESFLSRAFADPEWRRVFGGNLPRPEPWLPLVFSSRDSALDSLQEKLATPLKWARAV
jgi:hypothetical protein